MLGKLDEFMMSVGVMSFGDSVVDSHFYQVSEMFLEELDDYDTQYEQNWNVSSNVERTPHYKDADSEDINPMSCWAWLGCSRISNVSFPPEESPASLSLSIYIYIYIYIT